MPNLNNEVGFKKILFVIREVQRCGNGSEYRLCFSILLNGYLHVVLSVVWILQSYFCHK